MSEKVIIKVVDDGFNYKVSFEGDERSVGGGIVSLLKILATALEEHGRTPQQADEMIQEIFDEYKKARNKE